MFLRIAGTAIAMGAAVVTALSVAPAPALTLSSASQPSVSRTVTSFNDGFTESKRDDCEQGFAAACAWLIRGGKPRGQTALHKLMAAIVDGKSFTINGKRYVAAQTPCVHTMPAPKRVARDACGKRNVPAMEIWSSKPWHADGVTYCADGVVALP